MDVSLPPNALEQKRQEEQKRAKEEQGGPEEAHEEKAEKAGFGASFQKSLEAMPSKDVEEKTRGGETGPSLIEQVHEKALEEEDAQKGSPEEKRKQPLVTDIVNPENLTPRGDDPGQGYGTRTMEESAKVSKADATKAGIFLEDLKWWETEGKKAGSPPPSEIQEAEAAKETGEGEVSQKEEQQIEEPSTGKEPAISGEEVPEVKEMEEEQKLDQPKEKPEPEVEKFEPEVKKPEAEVKKPEAEVKKPEAEVVKPELEVEKPEPEVEKPEPEVKKPEAEVEKPEAEVEKPEAEVQPKASELQAEGAVEPPSQESTLETPTEKKAEEEKASDIKEAPKEEITEAQYTAEPKPELEAEQPKQEEGQQEKPIGQEEVQEEQPVQEQPEEGLKVQEEEKPSYAAVVAEQPSKHEEEFKQVEEKPDEFEKSKEAQAQVADQPSDQPEAGKVEEKGPEEESKEEKQLHEAEAKFDDEGSSVAKPSLSTADTPVEQNIGEVSGSKPEEQEELGKGVQEEKLEELTSSSSSSEGEPKEQEAPEKSETEIKEEPKEEEKAEQKEAGKEEEEKPIEGKAGSGFDPSNPMIMEGTWNLVRNEGYDKYLEALGTGLLQKSLSAVENWSVEFKNLGENRWKIYTNTTFKHGEWEFCLDEETEEETVDGRHCMTTVCWEDGVLTQKRVGKDGDKGGVVKREFKGDEMEVTAEVDDVTCKRFYHRQR